MNESTLLRIAIALEGMIAISGQAPEWEYPMSAFPSFEWTALGMSVLDKEAGAVYWMGHRYNKLETEAGIIYQRPCGHLRTAVLISFYK